MNKEVQYIFDIIRFVFHCGEYPKYDDTINLNKVYDICVQHHLDSLVACGISKLPYKMELPQQIYNKFISAWKKAMMVDLAQEEALKELTDELNKQKIDFMPLKGIYLKRLYPSPELRIMSDLDFLYPLNKEKQINNLMLKLGYEGEYCDDHHNVYFKKPFLNIEMHHSIVEKASRFSKYYKDLFLREYTREESCYIMSWDDFYIFHIVHFIKHFSVAGCGIRFLVDQYVLQTKLKNLLNKEYIDTELKKLGIYDFEQNMSKLTKNIFKGNLLSDYENDILNYMMDSGMYGTTNTVYENQISLTKKFFLVGKIKRLINAIFLPIRSMRIIYPYVDKYPILLPVGWVHRWIRSIFFRRNRIKETIQLNTVDNDTLSQRRAFLNKVGVNERYL